MANTRVDDSVNSSGYSSEIKDEILASTEGDQAANGPIPKTNGRTDELVLEDVGIKEIQNLTILAVDLKIWGETQEATKSGNDIFPQLPIDESRGFLINQAIKVLLFRMASFLQGFVFLISKNPPVKG